MSLLPPSFGVESLRKTQNIRTTALDAQCYTYTFDTRWYMYTTNTTLVVMEAESMASKSRKEVVRPGEVGVYHCWSCCVRRAFLCGQDPVSSQDFSKRRDWIVDFEKALTAQFAIEVGFHAELANHLHLIIRNRPDLVETWSDEEVARRWLGGMRHCRQAFG